MKIHLLKIVTLGCMIATTVSAAAQNFEYADLKLSQVTFSGDNLPIKKDNGTGSYSGPQYIRASGVSNPVAYPSDNKPRVQANFIFTCSQAPDSIYIRGIGPNEMLFAYKKVAINGTAGAYNFTYPATYGNVKFLLDKIDYFKPYVINWEISFDNTYWRFIDSSANTLYVTRGNPMSETYSFKLFETVYDISCRNAVGSTTETATIAAIWTEFTDQQVLNVDGDTLLYYRVMNTSNTSLPALLKYKDAQCYTFAELFLACMKIQGISRTNNYINITPNGDSYCGNTVNRFIVKNWDFGTPTAAALCSNFPYTNQYTNLIPYPYNAYSFTYEEVSDADGLPGPGNSNPSSYFNNHQIAYVDGVYYDACYGVSYPTLAAYTAACIEGWSYRYPSGGAYHCFFTNDMSLNAFSPSATTY